MNEQQQHALIKQLSKAGVNAIGRTFRRQTLASCTAVPLNSRS
jgi:hypothetical protein